MCSMWFTLSMADNHWNDLHAMVNRDKNGKPKTFPVFSNAEVEAKWKRKFCRKNPHLVDQYFSDKVRSFFSEMFTKDGFELEWLWYHVEYQARGAPHIHGCFKFKNDPCLTKHAADVFRGRLASRALNDQNLMNGPDFDPYVTELDVWKTENYNSIELIQQHGVDVLHDHICIGIQAEKIISAYHDFLLSTTNECVPLPIDANNTHTRESTTLFDPNDEFAHPSSVDLKTCLQDIDLKQDIYCKSINAQSRHKHQPYCDKNHKKREQRKREEKHGHLSPNKTPSASIPCNCRFEYPKPLRTSTHVKVEVNGDNNRLKIASKRNDVWINSHMRAAMEVCFVINLLCVYYTSTHTSMIVLP